MTIQSEFSVALNGDIRSSGPSNFTVLELHRYLQGLADDAQMSGDDLLDITSSDPSTRSTNNIITLNPPYNIDDTTAQYLFDGSISQDDGDTLYAGLIVSGEVVAGTELIVVRDNVIITEWWGTGINPDAGNLIISRMLIRVRGGTGMVGALIDGGKIRVLSREFNDQYKEFPVTMGLGNNFAAISTLDDPNNDTAEATVATWGTITNTEGYQTIDIDNDGTPEPYYSQWNRAAYTINQLYERLKWIQRRGTATSIHGMNGDLFRGITHEWDYDGESGTINEDDLLGWGPYFAFNGGVGTFTLGEYCTVGASLYMAKIVYYSGAGATGNLALMLEDTSEVIQASDEVTGLSSGATADINGAPVDIDHVGGMGVLLADDSSDTVWIQIVAGTAPSDDTRVWSTDNDGYHAVNGSFTSRPVSPEFAGLSTGTSITGAFGLGIEYADLTQADQLTDLTNAPNSPPNLQQFDVTGLVSGEDYVLVAANDGADEMDYDQYALQTTLNASGQTAVVVTGAVDAMTPSSGWLRVQLDLNKSGDDGIYRTVAYTSWSFSTNTTFVTASTDWTDPDDATAANNVFVGLIDKLATGATESFTGIYGGDVPLLGRVRDGGATPIQPRDYPTVFSSSGGGFPAIRAAD